MNLLPNSEARPELPVDLSAVVTASANMHMRVMLGR
jgi:hypothetical protein